MDQQGGRNGASRLMKIGIIGAVVAALCCATPVLVILLGAVGLGAITGYLDYVLIPALLGFVGLAVYGYLKRGKAPKASP